MSSGPPGGLSAAPLKRAPSRGRRIDYGLLPELVGYQLRRAQARVFADFTDVVTDPGVTPGVFGVLVIIDANPGLSQSALAKAIGIERSTMVAVIDRLQGEGWVQRNVAAHDRRSYALALTADGTALLDRLVPKVRRHERRIARALSPEDIATLIGILSRIAPD
ncbi:MAG: MarR family transcriptional regulator [Rhodospirillales bacterium]|nr:MarR family transcriptional regulator [Rhodospirillales bacterium]